MVATDKIFAGTIPAIYEQYLVPLIFQPYAADLARLVTQLNPQSILEIAAGTGVATRALVTALRAPVRITATDLNQTMLDVARSTLPNENRIEWRQADALALPFGNSSFAAVLCQFGAMFFPDKRQGFREAHRVLEASGCFMFSVWDDISHNEFADVVTKAVGELFPNDPPMFLARTPHGYHDAEQISSALRFSGFSKIAWDVVEHISRAPSAREPAIAYCQGTPLRSEIEARGTLCLEEATDYAASALARRFGSGPIEGKISALVFTATRDDIR
jgi:ubiquinone/menaquinone biosynthesis C-methylase UbiE